MSTLIIWIMCRIIINKYHVAHPNIKLEARLKEFSRPEDYVAFLRQQAAQKDKIPAIKALRKQYPELSLIEANKLWQQIQ
ncbi:hypothetical protein JCM18903_2021 [Psychrobacter sp. JCM 18903]|uniref:hypothetical protein n=1 Tax=Psychrobacter sp. JCM 18903 TaxID=1298610 RepID=UPI000434DF03|nr:hypothetical protein [Psychrobacter sp. JCM 18903]GAF61977.1 hypothetical protein JCM18903_2021 [Psychrobacter sp. JCM 18903]